MSQMESCGSQFPVEDKILITTFYKFYPLKETRLVALKKRALHITDVYGLRGIFLIGVEGCNGTLSGLEEAVYQFKKFILQSFGEMTFKDSWSVKHPFHEMSVKIKDEIVSIKRCNLVPENREFHLSPSQWHKVLEEEKDALILDVRNKYETQIGAFKGAIDLGLDEFNEFPKYLEKSGLPKGKKILMYCTGGIRCEKAILSAQEQGYEHVYQLDGGILEYLREFPNQKFEGECFVFDYRVAVDQSLKPSRRYRLCPHCGESGDQPIKCNQCGRPDIVCLDCLNKSDELRTCSKNCAHHFKLGHRSRRPHFDGHRKRIVKP